MINIKYKQILTSTALILPLLASLVVYSDTSHEQTSEKLKPVFAEKITAITVTPENWPKQTSPIKRSPEQEAKIVEILAKMTLEEKVGQVIQGDIASVTPQEAGEYNLGSVLNGGSSAPNGDIHAPPEEWLQLADEFYQESTDTSDGGVGIPLLWGIDAVHGNNNVVGATLFPHNIGLGAANDPNLMRKIGEITAKEILVVGIDWTFAPTLAVVQNDKWGRTYESYSENPEIVASFAGPLVEGIQGKVNSDNFLSKNHLLANVKHFLGDGGTKDGKDQGDTLVSEAIMRDIHGAGYPPAIQHGALVVMASFNSWHGRKMHGSREMLNDILVERLGFDGVVVGDWNGHGQVAGCSNVSCPQAFNAGLDMFMAPDSWKELYKNTLKQVKSGEISLARLDEAVSRILRVKLRAGLFDAGLPSKRPFASKFELLSSSEHKAVAREAVRKSLVLLKNNNQLLPLQANSKVLVAGGGANNIAQQSGGWTLSWQGTGNNNSHFPNAESIYQGIEKAVQQAGGQVELNENGDFETKPDVAIVVFGEQPYAEFQGDVTDLDYKPNADLALLTSLKEQGIPTVTVFLSGRGMWVNPELNVSDAFVAAWLPGSEGGGVADLLFKNAQGSVQYDFTGRLSFSWPATPLDVEVNIGDENYQPLFAYGYGLSVKDNQNLALLSEEVDPSVSQINDSRFLFAGDPVQPWRLVLNDAGGNTQVSASSQASSLSKLLVEAKDNKAQEDAMQATWSGEANLLIQGNPVDLTTKMAAGMALAFNYNVLEQGASKIILSTGCGLDCGGELDITTSLKSKTGQGWQQATIALSCFAKAGSNMQQVDVPFILASDAGLTIQLSEIKIVAAENIANCDL
ncbi:glycoside hydrolase family 3 protein [Paraglaciecola arctica]|uniref:Beta-glucosidase n=1 Tax=Paraglaciecola arctica BSs20135 TaxID=493475 RepID=K6YCB7_9ALTE|nr:exo 1,3/1,4-beta-D-glucan glucohydrolase [Paraglaciecola arctica]GAC21606.1 beta-glucosidase [Paraglaciecola arctica BSs20135]